jgi:hypothetical protein
VQEGSQKLTRPCRCGRSHCERCGQILQRDRFGPDERWCELDGVVEVCPDGHCQVCGDAVWRFLDDPEILLLEAALDQGDDGGEP